MLGLRRQHAAGVLCRRIPALRHLLPRLRRQPPVQGRQRRLGLRLQLDRGADEGHRQPHARPVPALLHRRRLLEPERERDRIQRRALLSDPGQGHRHRECAEEAHRDHGPLRPPGPRGPAGGRMGHLVGRGAGHQPGTSLPAEHDAGCDGGGLHPQHLPPLHPPREDGEHRPGGQCPAVDDPDPRRPDGPDPDLPRIPHVQCASGRPLRAGHVHDGPHGRG